VVEMVTASGVKSFNRKESNRLVNDIAERIIENIHQQLEDDDTNFSGDLSSSFKKGKEGEFITVESDSKYSGFIEFGMPAGENIDKEKLRAWVEGKLGVTSDEELTVVTNKIYGKLIKDGISPRRYFRKSIRKFLGKHAKHTIRAKNSSTKQSTGSFNKSKPGKNLRKLITDFKSITKKASNVLKKAKSARGKF